LKPTFFPDLPEEKMVFFDGLTRILNGISGGAGLGNFNGTLSFVIPFQKGEILTVGHYLPEKGIEGIFVFYRPENVDDPNECKIITSSLLYHDLLNDLWRVMLAATRGGILTDVINNSDTLGKMMERAKLDMAGDTTLRPSRYET
jgi:hypothetical protein